MALIQSKIVSFQQFTKRKFQKSEKLQLSCGCHGNVKLDEQRHVTRVNDLCFMLTKLYRSKMSLWADSAPASRSE